MTGAESSTLFQTKRARQQNNAPTLTPPGDPAVPQIWQGVVPAEMKVYEGWKQRQVAMSKAKELDAGEGKRTRYGKGKRN
jgi:hypothetical protein